MGGALSRGEDNDELVDYLVEAGFIKTILVERIFRAVDRADYCLDSSKQLAYRPDLTLNYGNLNLLAPCIYSEVLESLKLEPGLSFLNLGSGTGYLSTMVGLAIGPYGVNHGVELHFDVVEYAEMKLKEFKENSLALDEYEFCEPQFVVGNCLQLDSSSRQYDRVYCGASCPKEHENYMKNLIKIGGILLMPLGDQLLQIKRTSQDIWDTKSILPVSFAPLILPAQNSEETVKLPDFEPLTLMEVCRLKIRQTLKSNVDKEHPNLKEHKRRNPKRKKVIRIVIDESEDSGQGAEQAEPSFYVDEESGVFCRIVNRRQRLNRRRMDRLNDDGDALSSSSEDTDEDSDEMESSLELTLQSSVAASTPNSAIKIREGASRNPLGEGTSGGGGGTSLQVPQNGKTSTPSDVPLLKTEEKATNKSYDDERLETKLFRHRRKALPAKDAATNAEHGSDEEEMDPSTTIEFRPSGSSDRKRAIEEDDDVDDDDIEDGDEDDDDIEYGDEDDDDIEDGDGKNADSFRKRQSPIIWTRVADEDTDSNEDDVQMEEESYTMLIREKINLLPIPNPLKMYLNHDRKL